VASSGANAGGASTFMGDDQMTDLRGKNATVIWRSAVFGIRNTIVREFTVRYPAPYADPGALPKLWAQHPVPLVGVRTGTGSVDVLDLDTRAPAREWGNVSRTFIRSDELADVSNQTATERELPDA
jgi:hypothetical protein